MESGNKTIKIDLNIFSFFKFLIVILLVYFLFLIKDILIIFFAALILTSALTPSVDWMQSKKIPRSVGILLIYLTLFSIIGAAIYLIVPPISVEVRDIAKNFPLYYEQFTTKFSFLNNYTSQSGDLSNIQNDVFNLSSNLNSAASGIFSTVSGIFGGIFSFFLVLVLTFYMTAEKSAIKKLVWSIVPAKHQVYAMRLINGIQIKIGLWLRGQLVLNLIVFLLAYFSLLILGVQYALVLALIAGLTEFVPYIGPVLGAVPAVFLSFTQVPTLAIFVALTFYIIHLVESNILVPKIMQKAVGLNPIVSIAVLMIGFQLAGILGAILSVPVATACSVFVQDIFDNKTDSDIIE